MCVYSTCYIPLILKHYSNTHTINAFMAIRVKLHYPDAPLHGMSSYQPRHLKLVGSQSNSFFIPYSDRDLSVCLF